jgi:hypothetical protein
MYVNIMCSQFPRRYSGQKVVNTLPVLQNDTEKMYCTTFQVPRKLRFGKTIWFDGSKTQ